MHVFVHVGIIIEGAARARCRRLGGAAELVKICVDWGLEQGWLAEYALIE